MALNYQDVGKNIKAYRLLQNLSQEDLAEKLHVNFNYISKIERGVSYPSLDLFVAIAREIHVSLDALIGVQPDMQLPAASDFQMLLSDCNADELKLLAEVARFMKDLLREYGI